MREDYVKHFKQLTKENFPTKEDDKDKSGFTFFDEITFPANTKVGLTAWSSKNKNEKTVLNISIEDFETDYGKFMERAAKKKESSDSSFDKF